MPAQLKRRLKAVIMSAFLVPGAGQYYLGRKLRGLILMVLSVLLVFVIAVSIYDSLSSLVRQDFLEGSIELSLMGVVQYAFHKTADVIIDIRERIGVWLFIFVVVWIYGICDALSSHGHGFQAGVSGEHETQENLIQDG